MHALLFDGQLRFDSTYPSPHEAHGAAHIYPHIIGICNIDSEIARGSLRPPGAFGHTSVRRRYRNL
jgi:hypothetical protein